MQEERCLQHVYMQCMKNQSANLGTYTIDGCGEFVPDDSRHFCIACGCHRSFHSKVPASSNICQQLVPPVENQNQAMNQKPRRARTNFTPQQKEKMGSFAERIGWRILNREREEDEEVERFLEETGVSRRAFKVWMHNHRNAAQTQTAADSSSTETDDSAPVIAAGINDIVDVEVDDNGNRNSY